MIEVNEDTMLGYLWRCDHIFFNGGEDGYEIQDHIIDQLYAQMMGWA